MKNKLLKTFLYRITASGLAQSFSWILFSKIEVNAVVLSIDLIQMVYYFIFESVWGIDKKQIASMRKRFDFSIKTYLTHQRYSEKAAREISKWYGV
ncbi:DUF2061 domain-containing protein [Thermoproteota archaeon]